MGLNNVIIIAGPTATGKTQQAIDLAKKCVCEIINFDSLLFYRELNIGTAKPSPSHRQGVPHHLISSHSIKSPVNAADFCELALPLIDNLHRQDKIPILVGGSGFYLKALIYGMFPTPKPLQEAIARSNKWYQEEGISPFIQFLKKNDYPSFQKLHSNDHYRIRRAVEFYWSADYPISQAPARIKKTPPRYKQKRWELRYFYLDIPKEEHFSIIQQRTQAMLDQGLVEEVKDLLKRGFSGQEKPLLSVGYKQTLDYLQGKLDGLESLKEKISIATRQLAKAQRTFFNSQIDLARLDLSSIHNHESIQ